MDNNYLGNPNLKRANVKQEWTKENLVEYQRCMDDPQYFICLLYTSDAADE